MVAIFQFLVVIFHFTVATYRMASEVGAFLVIFAHRQWRFPCMRREAVNSTPHRVHFAHATFSPHVAQDRATGSRLSNVSFNRVVYHSRHCWIFHFAHVQCLRECITLKETVLCHAQHSSKSSFMFSELFFLGSLAAILARSLTHGTCIACQETLL